MIKRFPFSGFFALQDNKSRLRSAFSCRHLCSVLSLCQKPIVWQFNYSTHYAYAVCAGVSLSTRV